MRCHSHISYQSSKQPIVWALYRVTPDSSLSIVSSLELFRWLRSWDHLCLLCCDRGHNLIFHHWKLTFWHRTLSLGSKNPQSSLTNPSNLQMQNRQQLSSRTGPSWAHQSARRPAQAFYPMMGKFAKLICKNPNLFIDLCQSKRKFANVKQFLSPLEILCFLTLFDRLVIFTWIMILCSI